MSDGADTNAEANGDISVDWELSLLLRDDATLPPLLRDSDGRISSPPKEAREQGSQH